MSIRVHVSELSVTLLNPCLELRQIHWIYIPCKMAKESYLLSFYLPAPLLY